MATAALNISFERSREECAITIESGILSRLGNHRVFAGASSIAIVTDDVVGKLYVRGLENQLSKIAKTSVIVFPHGEKSKSLETSSRIASQMSDFGLDRKSMLVSLGGGVVGDTSGFVASIFKRGIKYVQIPTTLLAQVDSSIGGKTGVDTKWGKNQLGTFYQPSAIFIDPDLLDTLPQSEVINGLGEMVKSGIIADKRLFTLIEKLPSFDIERLKPLILQTCKIKARVVGEDQFEQNQRSILNYGHTVGHALEASSGFKLPHGKSVILGMISEGFIGAKLGIFAEKDHERQRALLRRIIKNFHIRAQINSREVLRFAKLDKKSTSSEIKMVFPERIGRMHIGGNGSYLHSVPRDTFLESLRMLEREF
jgi:3-dehydroquinate synthase